MSIRRKGHKNARHLVEEMDLESEFSMPHVPAYTHYSKSDTVNGRNRSDTNLGDSESRTTTESRGLKGDYSNIALLLFLYILQGIPLGLSGSIPLVLQARKVGYRAQAMFSFVFWPFSLKLLWAPLVDALYNRRMGRRKSWLVPTQYLMGIFMFVLSGHISWMLGEIESSTGEKSQGPINVFLLTSVFFALYFLAATQDIAVDGWALTMLSRRNVGWASTCNAVGQTVGYSLGNIVFLALESPEFCNMYIRSTPSDVGVVTLGSFLYFWGIVFMISTTLVLVFKSENADEDEDEVGEKGPLENTVQTYKQLLSVLKLPAVQSLAVIYLTCKVGFCAIDSVTGLKLVEKGVPKEKLAILAVPMVPIQVLLPLLISKFTAGPRPMNLYLKAFPCRLLMGIVFMYVVHWTPSTKLANGDYPFYYYVTLVAVYGVHQVTLYCMFCSCMSFNATISDPAIGGTYMTLLNTVSNLGGNWPSTIALYFVDSLTWKSCQGGPGYCESPQASQKCEEAGGLCFTEYDGYYTEVVITMILGVLWLLWRRKRIQHLQQLPESSWKCLDESKVSED